MAILTYLSRKLNILSYLAENPTYFKLYGKGINFEVLKALDKIWIRSLNIKTIIDIGANIGQFSLIAQALFPKSQIYAFEPLPECFVKLNERMSHLKNFNSFNVALGDKSGELEFEQNKFSASSSFLKMLDTHKKLFPQTSSTEIVKVRIEQLDNFQNQIEITDPLLIKIDVQGYEELVIRGGEKIIKQAKVIIIETSFQPLYEGQCLFKEIYSYLDKLGFAYHGVIYQLSSPNDERILQADCIFIKE